MAAKEYYIRKKKDVTDIDDKKFVTTRSLKLLERPIYPGWKEKTEKNTFKAAKSPKVLCTIPSGKVVTPESKAVRVINKVANYKANKVNSKNDINITFYKVKYNGKTGWIAKKLPAWGSAGVKEQESKEPDVKKAPSESANNSKLEKNDNYTRFKDAASIDTARDLRANTSSNFINTMAKNTKKAKTANGKEILTKVNVTKHDDDDQFNDISEKAFKHALRARTIIYEDRDKWDYKYNRMQWANPYYAVGPTREYLFFTKPDLHIMGKSTDDGFTDIDKLNPTIRDTFWVEMKEKYRNIIADLQYSSKRTIGRKDVSTKDVSHDRSEFIRILTNAVSGTLDLPDVSSDTVDTPANIYGTTLQYKKSGAKSDEGFDFSLEFTDNQQLEVYHLFKMWSEYSNLKDIGMVTPPGPKNLNPYRINHILHDQIGIFKFIVDEDMETIIYYAYLTGCFPKSVPRGSFANINPGLINYSIDWHAQFVEDMNPLILLHFNMLVRKQLGMYEFSNGKYLTPLTDEAILNKARKKYVPIYSNERQEINGGWRDIPIIHKITDKSVPTGSRYLLKWYDNK